MDLKQRILHESSQMLFAIGPSAMTMDMVARSCGISKRTLYEQFPDKKSLVKECLLADVERTGHDLQSIYEHSSNCFMALFKTFYYMRKKMGMITYNFFPEIRRMYPDLNRMIFTANEHKRVVDMSAVLREAQQQGLVEARVNTDMASFLFFVTTSSLNGINQFSEYSLNRLSEFGFTQMEVMEGAFVNFLRGVATPKGLELIDSYLQKNN